MKRKDPWSMTDRELAARYWKEDDPEQLERITREIVKRFTRYAEGKEQEAQDNV